MDDNKCFGLAGKDSQHADANKLSKEELQQIMQACQLGNSNDAKAARLKLIKSLKGLMHLIIKRYFEAYIPEHYDELLQEGAIGVLKGMDKYDISAGAPTTYFYWYIKHEMQAYINDAVMHTTEYYASNIQKIKVAIRAAEGRGERCSRDGLAKITHIPMSTLNKTIEIMNRCNELHYDAASPSYRDNLISRTSPSAEVTFMERQLYNEIGVTMVRMLSSEELFVINSVFGFNCASDGMKQKDLALLMNVPVERVHKIYRKALGRLKNEGFKDSLEFYCQIKS